MTLMMIVAASLSASAAVYAQRRIPRHTAGAAKIGLARMLLIATGLASGYVAATSFGHDGMLALLAFVVRFGAVHVPAALILFIKTERGAGKS
jgi:hypothetical protein